MKMSFKRSTRINKITLPYIETKIKIKELMRRKKCVKNIRREGQKGRKKTTKKKGGKGKNFRLGKNKEEQLEMEDEKRTVERRKRQISSRAFPLLWPQRRAMKLWIDGRRGEGKEKKNPNLETRV